jgi:hypothetical protein
MTLLKQQSVKYESGDYIDAIVILNRLIPAAGYDRLKNALLQVQVPKQPC